MAEDQPTHEGLARVADQPVVARPSPLPAPSAPRRLSWRRRQVGAAAAAASAAAVGPASAAGRAALSPPQLNGTPTHAAAVHASRRHRRGRRDRRHTRSPAHTHALAGGRGVPRHRGHSTRR